MARERVSEEATKPIPQMKGDKYSEYVLTVQVCAGYKLTGE